MSTPLYRQVAQALQRRIESGELAEGARVSTEDQLMEAYRASRNTVRRALKELAGRGLVHTLHGRGTFVSGRVSPIVITLTSDRRTGAGGGEGIAYAAEIAARGRSPSIPETRVEIMKAPPAVADLLRVPGDSEVISRRQRRYVDGEPWSLQTSYYPRSLADRAPRLLSTDDIPEGTVAYLAQHGIRQAGYQDSLGWRAPEEEEARYFDLGADGHVQVVEINRLGFDQGKNRVRLTVTVYRADRNRFTINVGDVPAEESLFDDAGT
jgi:GntR family transcriptional regulator